jgi:hypothetical protein
MTLLMGSAPFPAEARVIEDAFGTVYVLHLQWADYRHYCRFALDACAPPPPGFDPWERLYGELLGTL